jgi:hypothetical protein
MANSNTEHSRKLRCNTANEAKKKAIKNGAYSFSTIIKDKERADAARTLIKNNREFIEMAIDILILKKNIA